MKIPFLKPKANIHFQSPHLECVLTLDNERMLNASYNPDRGIVLFVFGTHAKEYYPVDAVKHMRDLALFITQAADKIEGATNV